MDGMNQNNNDPYNHNPYQQQGYQTQGYFGAPPIQPYDPRKNRGVGKKVAIGAACGLIVLIGVGIGALAYYRSTPAYRIGKGMMNLAREIGESRNPLAEKIGMSDIAAMMQEEGSHVETALDFTVDVPFVGETTLGIDTDLNKDMQAKEMSSETSLSLMNYDFAHLNLYADDEVLCFSVPELFLEDMYIENENVVSQYNDSILAGGYPSDAADFSINLFPDDDERISLREWRNWSSVTDRIEGELNACREAMTMEKVETGLYRVTFPQKESDRLLKSVMENYGEMTGAKEEPEMWKEYQKLILSDVSLLFEIDKNNRIESIVLEDPVAMLDGGAGLEAEIFFLGEERSIDKIQGKFKAHGVDGVEREVLWQTKQAADEELYRMDMDLKLDEDGEPFVKMKLLWECDALKDTFDFDCSAKDEETEVQLVMEGNVDDYVTGESVKADLDNLTFHMDGEEIFKLTGDIDIEPLRGTIDPSVRPETAFFEMSESDWYGILLQIEDKYGSLFTESDSIWN